MRERERERTAIGNTIFIDDKREKEKKGSTG